MNSQASLVGDAMVNPSDPVQSIPSDWRVVRLRHAFSFNKGLTITKEHLQDEGVPCVNYGEVHSKYGFEVDPDRHQLKCVDTYYLKNNRASLLQRGDFVFADTSEDIEGSGNFTCYMSERQAFAGYHTLIAKPKVPMNSRFMAYLFDSQSFRAQVQSEVTGVKVFSISQAVLKPTLVWFPPEQEQCEIAKFLDEKCAKADAAIRIKEEQIALLRERRQILIQEAVTRGLNPSAPMKDSGINWIGQIPVHWEVKPLLTEAKIKSKSNRPDLQLLSVYLNLGVVKFDDVEEKRTNATSLDLSKYQVVEPGDLVLNNQQAWRGSVGVSFETGIVSPAYIILGLSIRWDPGFANLYFRAGTTVVNYLINSKGVGTIQRNLYWPQLKRSLVIIPPLEEQRSIVQHVKGECARIDSAITTKEEQISALKEYKASVINAAVTGKIKVI